MDTESILKALERYDGTFPREALLQAIEQKETITPHLLDALQYARDHALELPGEHYLHTCIPGQCSSWRNSGKRVHTHSSSI
jgi:hypothetical protein